MVPVFSILSSVLSWASAGPARNAQAMAASAALFFQSIRTSWLGMGLGCLGLMHPERPGGFLMAKDNSERWFGGEWRLFRLGNNAMHFPTHEQKQALLEKVMRFADQRLQ